MSKQNHPFHLVDPSPWPLASAFSALILAIGAVLLMHGIDKYIFPFGLVFLLICFFGWWKDVVKESNTKGIYNDHVETGLKIGMALFIASEVMFFAGFFWSYFHASINPIDVIGNVWPPKGIKSLNPFELPYFNTLLLLLSGTTVTWAHHELLQGKYQVAAKGLLITVLLGLTFTAIQAIEYHHAGFGFKDGIYSSNFYMATGFHGVHVIIGTIFLFVCWWRMKSGQFDKKHHVGFEAAAWYWHFVDVVWLFLFVAVYWYGYQPIAS